MALEEYSVKFIKGAKIGYGVFKYTSLKNGEELIEYLDEDDYLQRIDCHSFHAFNKLADELRIKGKILLIKGCRKDVYSQRPIGVHGYRFTIGQRLDHQLDEIMIYDEETDLSALSTLEERREYYHEWCESIMGIPYKEYLENTYNYPAVSMPFSLNRSHVPQNLRFLTAYVEYFISQDQKERERFMKNAPLMAFKDLEKVISDNDQLLDDWLAGPEADIKPPKPEYIAFSLLRLVSYEYSSFR